MKLSSSQKHAIVIAVIPVVGALLIGILANMDKLKCNSSPEQNGKINDVQEKTAARTNDALIQQRYDEVNDDFTEATKLSLSTEIIKSIMDTLYPTLGTFQDKTFEFHRVYGQDVVHFFNRFSRRDLLVMLVFDDKNKILGFYINPSSPKY